MSHSEKDRRPDPNPQAPLDHFQEIYQNRPVDYHRMISAEDVDGNILPTLAEIASLAHARVLDLGSGTGRIPQLLGTIPDHILAMDISLPMLVENRKQREAAGGNWDLIQADMQALPLLSGSYDLAIAGWAIGHQMFWHHRNWKRVIGDIIGEMERAVVRGGKVILLETLGTGAITPSPPAEELSIYYDWLQNEGGFTKSVIQTDYLFPSADRAAAETAFFFGEDLSTRIVENGWERIPEWTGIWFKTVLHTHPEE